MAFVAWSFGQYLACQVKPWLLLLCVPFFYFAQIQLLLVSIFLGYLTVFISQADGSSRELNLSQPSQIKVISLNPIYKKGIITGLGQVNGQLVVLSLRLHHRASNLGNQSLIVGRAKCKLIKKSLLPFSFFVTNAIKGVRHFCVVSNYSILNSTSEPHLIYALLEKLKKAAISRFLQFKDYFGTKPILISTSIGYPTDLKKETDKLFRETGLYHLLVVSGYQLSVVAVLALNFSRKLRYLSGLTSVKFAFLEAALVITLASLYAFIAGADKPIIRALCFLIFYVFNQLFKFKVNILLASAYVVCIIEPGAQFSLSFLLTFSALLGFLISGLHRPLLATILASIFSGLALSFFTETEPKASWIFFNLFFAFPLSLASTALPLLGLIENLVFRTDYLWFAGSAATKLLIKAVEFSAPLNFYSPALRWLAPVALLYLLKHINRNITRNYLAKLWRRKKYKFGLP